MSVPALYIATPAADPRACTVRVWLKAQNLMLGALKGAGAAEMVEPEDRLCFDLTEQDGITAIRKGALVSIEAGEAYRIELPYDVDRGFQSARVIRLSAADAASLPVPA